MDAVNNNLNSGMNLLYSSPVHSEISKTEEEVPSLAERLSQLIQERKEEFEYKIRTGDAEHSYQIGADSYTQREWERLLKNFDRIQDIMRGEAEEASRKAKKVSQDTQNEISERSVELLFVESTFCTYPSPDPDKEEERYITFYDEKGIHCRKEGESQDEWFIEFDDASQYEKVMEFLSSIDSQGNLRYACHENFWRDLLDGKIDMEAFQDFLDTRVSNGIPNYLDETEDGVRINETAAQWAKYMNKPNLFHLIDTSSEDFFQW